MQFSCSCKCLNISFWSVSIHIFKEYKFSSGHCVSFIISCFHLKIVLAKFVHIVSIANNFSVTYNRAITSILYCGTQAVTYIIAMKCFEVSSYHGCLLSKTDICPFHFLLTLRTDFQRRWLNIDSPSVARGLRYFSTQES